MPTLNDYEAWKARRQEADAKQSAIVLNDARSTNPDEFASDVKLGKAFGVPTGVAGVGRSTLQSRLNELRDRSVLKISPRTSEWLKQSDNARAAWDDVDNLSWFEGVGRATKNTAIRAGNRVGQMGNQYMLEQNVGRLHDRQMSFGDILDSERTRIRGNSGEEHVMVPTIGGFLSAGARYIDARYADLIGTDDAANAAQSAALLQRNLADTAAASKSAAAQAFESEAMKPGLSLGEAVKTFFSGLVGNPGGGLAWMAETLGENSAPLLAAAGVSAATRNPAAVAGTMFAGSYGTERFTDPANFLQEKGFDLSKPDDVATIINSPDILKEAADRGAIRGMVIGAFDAISMGVAGRVLAKNPVIEAIAQSVQQAVSGSAGEYAARRAAGQAIEWSEILAEGFAELATAPVDMGIAGRKFANDRRAAESAGETSATIGEIADKAQGSKLRQRLDSSFADFVGKAVDGTPVQDLYIPADKMQALFQSFRYDPAEFLEGLPGVDVSSYEAALATGGDVRIPTAAYAAKIAGMEIDAPLREHMRFDPGAMTLAEAKAFNENSADIQQQAFEEAEAVRVAQDAERAVADQELEALVGSLRAAGRSNDVAVNEALPIVAMRRTMAERAGISPEEFAQRYPLPEVRRQKPEDFKKNIDDLKRQLAEMRSYVARPADRGSSLLEAISEYGGINDVGGELKARNADVIKRGKGKKTLRLSRGGVADGARDLLGKVTGSGRKHGIDDVAQAMIEAGYLQTDPIANEYRAALENGTEVPDIGRALLAAIDEELAGRPQYAGNPETDERAAAIEANVAYLDSLGLSLSDTDDTIRAALTREEKGQEFNQASLRQKLTKLRAALTDLIDFAKTADRGKSQSVEIAQVSDAVADLVEEITGADIHGFRHTIDSSAVRHILKNHGDAGKEESRGQLAVTNDDIVAIPDLISAPDKIVTGAKGKRGEDLIGYLKKMPDGTTLYIEEARKGRGALAAVSMRKYPATSDYSSIAATVSPNARNDGGNSVTISDLPENSKTLFQANRGAIQLPLGGAADSSVIISLFQNADLSTTLHESGHYFLYVLEDMATPPGVSPEIVEMNAAVKAWWRENAGAVAAEAKQVSGVEVTVADVEAMIDTRSTGDATKDAAIVTGMHEQFARGYEAYLMEGKAPSVELRSAFERFTQWLLRLYRNIRGLNVEVSPEIKTVFDRLLATDAEIEEARSNLSDEMLFSAAAAAGISPEDYRHLESLHQQARDEAKMKLRREVMAPLKREREQWFKDERATVKGEVTTRLQALPIYRAIQELRFGKDFEGNAVTPMKLDRAIVEREFGAGHIQFLPGATRKGHGHMNAVFGSAGVHPDIVAGMYGFPTGREFLNELENTVSIREAIEQETDRIMLNRHGDVLRDGSLEEEAIDAMHGDKRGQFLAAELNVLNKKVAGSKTTTSQEAREAVRRTIKSMKVRDASAPKRYLAAERKAATDAANAVARDDTTAAAEAKRRQLLNYHFYMEAGALAEQVDTVIDRMQKLNKPDHRLSKSRDVDYVKAARAIAGQFNLARTPSDFDMTTWLEQLKIDDEVSYDCLSQAIHVYSRGGQQSYRDITVIEFNDVKDAIDNLMETGKLAREAEIDGKKVELQQIRDELMQIASNRSNGKNVALNRRLTRMEKVRVRALSLLAALRRVEAWARDMDDGKAGSYVRYVVNPVMDALGAYRQDKATRLRSLLEIIDPRKDDLLGASIYAPELDYTFENKGELLHAILHTGNDSNRKKLLVGRNWEDGWDVFINRMHNEGVVTKADYDTAQAIWDLMETIKRPAQSAHRKMYGFYFQEIEPTAVETPFGSYKGGYVPAIVDNDASVDGTLRADQQALEQQSSSAMFPTTGRGFTKSRSEGYATPLALDLMMIPAHMDKVLRFTHVNPAIRQTARIVNNPGFRVAINEVSPGIVENMMIPWLQRAAMQAVEAKSTTPAGRALSSVTRAIRNRVGIHTMFLNVVNTAQQVTGFSSAMVLVKPGRVKSALIRFAKIGEGGAMREEAATLSAFMEDRIKNSSREMHGRIQEAIVKPGALEGIQAKFQQYGYILQQGAQNVIDVIVWHAAYDQAVAGGMDQGDAVREADSVIRRTMGSFAPEDVSMVETGNSFVRLFTMFYSYFNGQANLLGGELQTVMRTYGYKGAPRMFAIFMFGFTIPAMVGEMIVQAGRGELGDDDDDDGYLDDIASLFFGSQARYGAGMVPVVGQGVNAFMNTWNDKPYDDRLSTSPVIPALERVIRAPVSVYNAIIGGKNPTRGVQDGIAALGLILGIPTGQLVKSAGYGSDVASGRQSPENAADVLQGLMSGRDGTSR